MKRALLLLLVAPAVDAGTFAQRPQPKIRGDVYATARKKVLPPGRTLDEHRAIVRSLRLDADDLDRGEVALQLRSKLTDAELAELRALGIEVHPYTWVPPVPGKHPHGVITADVPYGLLPLLAADERILRVTCVERRGQATTDEGGAMIGVPSIHAGGLGKARTGKGVHVAIADSGLTKDLVPDPIETFDMTKGQDPDTWGTNVKNETSALTQYSYHGTWVTSILVSQGKDGQWIGTAPDADYSFYKIAKSGTLNDASTTDAIEAVNRALEIGADVFNLSYTYYDLYKDGSSALEQAVDHAVASGMTVFAAAGNGGTRALHDRVTLLPGQSALVQVEVSTGLPFTLRALWRDDDTFNENISVSCITLEGNESFEQVVSSMSDRGTEAKQFEFNVKLDGGEPDYHYLSITNAASIETQSTEVHLFSESLDAVFSSPHYGYLVGVPATADDAIAVGAWVQSEEWTNTDGETIETGEKYDTRASFSAIGPRIDGLLKPDILAPGSLTISRGGNVINYSKYYQVSGGGWIALQGTSASSPMAAGVAALLLEENPTLTPADIKQALTSSAHLADEPNEEYGHGLINAFIAYFDPAVQSIWVDFDVVAEGTGTWVSPFKTLERASLMAPPGALVRIKASTTSETGSYANAITVFAEEGEATLGQ
ncbi:MAG: S8 family serine peptidase [Planctomycetota bacterium]